MPSAADPASSTTSTSGRGDAVPLFDNVLAGTMLELSTGEIGMVVGTTAEGPRVRVIVDAEGGVPHDTTEFLLGSDARTVVRVLGSDAPVTPSSAPSRREGEPAPRPSEVVAEKPPATTKAPIARIALVRRATSIPPMVAPPTSTRAPRSASKPSPAPAIRPTLPAAPPDVRGTVARSPLTHLLVHVLTRGLTGSLLLHESETALHAIVFEAGAPTKAHTHLRGPRLGEVLVARGDLADHEVAPVVTRARASMRPIGRQLVAEGRVGASKIASAIEEQLDARISELAALPETTEYSFYDGQDVLPTFDAYRFDPLPRILVAARSWRDGGACHAALSRVGDVPLALHPHADLERFRPTEEERVAVEWGVAGGLGYHALLAEEVASPEAVRAILWTLLATRHLDLGTGRTPLGVRPQPAPPPVEPKPAADDDSRPSFGSFPAPAEGVPSTLMATTAPASSSVSTRGADASVATPPDVRITEADVETPLVAVSEIALAAVTDAPKPQATHADDPRRRAILEREALVGSSDAYRLLGVDERAEPDAIQRAYLEAAKTFHPDRLPPELADLKDRASRLFAALTEARDTLLDPAKRAAHDASRAQGVALGGERSEVERVLEAATNFQKAEVMLRRNDVAAAERFAALAAEGDPGTPEHLALHGYLLSMHGNPEATIRAIELLDRAAGHEAASDKVFFWRGSVRKKLGKLEGAVSDFRVAAEKNPKNLDAVREVRLWEMRASKRENAKKGLLAGLFKRNRD